MFLVACAYMTGTAPRVRDHIIREIARQSSLWREAHKRSVRPAIGPRTRWDYRLPAHATRGKISDAKDALTRW